MKTFEQWAEKAAPFLLDPIESRDDSGRLSRIVARQAWDAACASRIPEPTPGSASFMLKAMSDLLSYEAEREAHRSANANALRSVAEAALVAYEAIFEVAHEPRPDRPSLEAIWVACEAALAVGQDGPPTPQVESNAEASEAERVCGEAYQVVGSLLSDLGQFDTERAQKILDNLSHARLVHDDVLPWPSFDKSAFSWTSVQSRFPASEETVLVWRAEPFNHVDKATYYLNGWLTPSKEHSEAITHWAPLPPAPEQTS